MLTDLCGSSQQLGIKGQGQTHRTNERGLPRAVWTYNHIELRSGGNYYIVVSAAVKVGLNYANERSGSNRIGVMHC